MDEEVRAYCKLKEATTKMDSLVRARKRAIEEADEAMLTWFQARQDYYDVCAKRAGSKK
jgi:hypothetical protein